MAVPLSAPAGGGVASPLGSLVQLMRRDGLDEDDAELAMRAWVGWGSDGPGPLADYDHYAAWSAAEPLPGVLSGRRRRRR